MNETGYNTIKYPTNTLELKEGIVHTGSYDLKSGFFVSLKFGFQNPHFNLGFFKYE